MSELSPRDDDNYELLFKTGAQTLGAVAGIYAASRGASPLLAAVLSNASGDVAEGLARAASIALNKMAKRANIAWETLVHYSKLTDEELLNRVIADSVSLDMTIRILDAVVDSPDEEWIRALCSALVKGLAATDNSERDKYARAIDTLALLDPADGVVLAKMCESGTGWEKRRKNDTAYRVAVEEFPQFEETIDAVFARLSTFGLIDANTSGGGINWNGTSPWLVTPFGELCNTAVSIIGSDDESEED